MTLLEPLVALIIFGLAAVGFLEAFQATARATRDADEWIQAVSYAEAAMEQTKIASGVADAMLPTSGAAGFAREVTVERTPDNPALETVTVRVTLPRGGVFVLQRIVRAQ